MKKVLIATFSDIRFDSRIIRYLNYLFPYFEIILVGNGLLPANFKGKVTYFDLQYNRSRKNKNPIDFIIYYFELKLKLYKIIKQFSPDIIHSNDFETLLPCFLAYRKFPEYIIYDSHEIWSERIGIRRNFISRTLTYSEFVMEYLTIKRLVAKNIVTVSDGISNYLYNKFSLKLKPNVIKNIPSQPGSCSIPTAELQSFFKPIKNKIKFVYVGPITTERNLPLLLQSFSQMDSPNILLILIGSNNLNIDFTKNKNILHIERVSETNLYYYLKECDIGVHPMRTDDCLNHYFALPNKLFQYMQAGLALFVFENPESKSLIDTCNNGMASNFNSTDSIMLNLNLFLNNNLNQMKINSSKCFDNYYRNNLNKSEYLRIINSIR